VSRACWYPRKRIPTVMRRSELPAGGVIGSVPRTGSAG
jgi:hypothetical protein